MTHTFDTAYKKYNHGLRSFVYKHLTKNECFADDLVQETWLSIWKNKDEVRWDRPVGFLRTIARRRWCDYWRKKSNLETPTGCNDTFADIEDKLPIDMGFDDNTTRALNQLDKRVRDSLISVVVDENSHKATAEKMGVTIGTTLSRVHRGKAKLRRILLENK